MLPWPAMPDLSASEARWPPVLAVLVLLLLVVVLPDHLRLLPRWAPYLVATLAVLPMAAVAIGGEARWGRAERRAVLATATGLLLLVLVALGLLIRHILGGASPLGGLELLASSVIVWVCNVTGFALVYWQMDGGGPGARAVGGWPDWAFPQSGMTGLVPPGWRPAFVDYLYLAFATATALSTTDVVPLTARAKLAMMLETLVSMTTLVVVASRAINVLAG
jgi:uncharacterized membrane protein